MTILSQYTTSTMLSSQSWKVNVKTDAHYSALHSGKHWSFKSSLLSKKSENQHYEIILIYLKVPRILMLLYSWAMQDYSSTCSSSALKQPPLLTKHDYDQLVMHMLFSQHCFWLFFQFVLHVVFMKKSVRSHFCVSLSFIKQGLSASLFGEDFPFLSSFYCLLSPSILV